MQGHGPEIMFTENIEIGMVIMLDLPSEMAVDGPFETMKGGMSEIVMDPPIEILSEILTMIDFFCWTNKSAFSIFGE
jgi:hypothetical protein